MSLFENAGKMSIGSRLRLLTSIITEDAARIYELYDVEDFSPKWFPVFFVLNDSEKTITEIAQEIHHSQPSVTKIVKEMLKSGLIENKKDKEDKRRKVVGLTATGQDLATKMLAQQCVDIDKAIDSIIAESNHNLWEAIKEWEYLLGEKPLIKRVQEQKKLRESQKVVIVDYASEYELVFRQLNEQWISKYFELEETDIKSLENPQSYIIDRGGKILVALYDGEPVGVCALVKMNDPVYDYEMAKMAVSPYAQGKNIGWLLGEAIVQKAKDLGAKNIYLESNTSLKPAINLYNKLGFKKITGRHTPYSRCNIQMELTLN